MSFSLKNKRFKIIIFVLIITAFVLTAGLTLGTCGSQKQNITLQYWRPNFDPSSAFDWQIRAFQEQYGVKVEITTFAFEEYEDKLVNALASGQGPDVFAIHNDWLPKHIGKLLPAPDSTEELTFIDAAQYKQIFADVAFEDFVVNEKVYAVPLSIDTLALYYNKDRLNEEGLLPPADWDNFESVVRRLTKKDLDGEITQSAAAFGTATNINRSIDILSLLMLQRGAEMTDEARRRATFNQAISSDIGDWDNPGESALAFYTKFAQPDQDVYTWNTAMDYSIDAFTRGDTAMMFNYSYHIPTIRAKAPKLNFDIAAMPQQPDAERTVDFANYWGEAVSAQTRYPLPAWLFTQFLGSAESVKAYCDATSRPVSRLDLAEEQKSDLDLGIYAQQIFTAETWYRVDADAYERIFKEMIERVNLGQATPEEAVRTGAAQLSEFMENDPYENIGNENTNGSSSPQFIDM